MTLVYSNLYKITRKTLSFVIVLGRVTKKI